MRLRNVVTVAGLLATAVLVSVFALRSGRKSAPEAVSTRLEQNLAATATDSDTGAALAPPSSEVAATAPGSQATTGAHTPEQPGANGTAPRAEASPLVMGTPPRPDASPPDDPPESPRTSVAIDKAAPRLSDLRAEVEQNPHVTPRSLMAFSDSIQTRIEQNAQTEAGAERVFGELESCIITPRDKDSHSVQALCLLNARRLSERHAALEGRYRRLKLRADPEAIRRADAVE